MVGTFDDNDAGVDCAGLAAIVRATKAVQIAIELFIEMVLTKEFEQKTGVKLICRSDLCHDHHCGEEQRHY